jgi:sterol desaturase/sphingolipid hydroxylase (fatty acid hydroxylase superfamily)
MTEWISGKSGILVFAFLAVLLLERLFPAVHLRQNISRLGKNFSFAALNFLLAPLIVIPISIWAADHSITVRPDWTTGLVVDLVVLDCWVYFWHRANHRIPFLWRFHEVHHLDESLDASSAVRFHFGEVVMSALARCGVIWLFAVPWPSVVVFETVLTLAALFHHSNVKLPAWFERPLSHVIVTPSVHFVHHHAKQADTDSNYSTILAVWDFMFSSRSTTKRALDFKIGVEGLRDLSVLRLMLRPFYKR